MQKIEAGKLNVLAITLERLKVALKCNWDDLMNDFFVAVTASSKRTDRWLLLGDCIRRH